MTNHGLFRANALLRLQENRNNSLHEVKFRKFGKVLQVVGTVIETTLDDVPLGALVRVVNRERGNALEGEVVGFRKGRSLVVPFADPIGICASSVVECIEREPKIQVGDHLIGRVVDAYGRTLLGPPFAPDLGTSYSLSQKPINPLLRKRIASPFDTGVRALNSLLSFGEGQRVGIMAGSGVGKSVLIGMISRYSQADINVIALIGERGREVREFIEENLCEDGLKKSVVVVSTGDESALSRIRAAYVSTAIAEAFRDEGKRVLLLMDSLTRVAMAQREIGLAVGEPPTTKGYTPSVFAMLPKLLERAGNSDSAGSLTGIYTVLVDGDDFQDPVCDAARSILDGHINLSRSLADKNHFPAIDILSSASRVMIDIVEKRHMTAANMLRNLMAEYQKNEDLLNIGAYQAGANKVLDKAIEIMPAVNQFLRQFRDEKENFYDSVEHLCQLAGVQ